MEGVLSSQRWLRPFESSSLELGQSQSAGQVLRPESRLGRGRFPSEARGSTETCHIRSEATRCRDALVHVHLRLVFCHGRRVEAQLYTTSVGMVRRALTG